ncbi:BsuPI-related putative proteinase inhibitor [Dethiosulfatarculus sandiegensis]|uniref:Intracellular proteinase inhibitor BsuPI domain-containing protein n=1 Tax=Dethiosulfatarculus sandiegensis TaxID=1429043 RepID=A0A0D2HTY3_9BACT|nr:BsuPI-related putative proteinase inhibitor [Dethiosulfatarculus sandiegensis]KIX13928.1 hypothetical protein X474_12280 [Dethiosulfatarculus sandiegensis]
MAVFEGYLFSKLHLIGSKSEGVSYFLQLSDYEEVYVTKKAVLWQQDEVLHPYLNQKVSIKGELVQGALQYEEISPLGYLGIRTDRQEGMEVELAAKPAIIYLPKEGETPFLPLTMTLSAIWTKRSVWHGLCPTSQIYDFWAEFNGKEIWRWSADRVFMPVVTQVVMTGHVPYHYSESWLIPPEAISEPGTLMLNGIYIPTGQEDSLGIQVKSD